ncbi:MAG: cytochrome c1 [Mariprofundaceae bacterium]|nr:cytochrome c1 [Mariprofundaceae bacterium]
MKLKSILLSAAACVAMLTSGLAFASGGGMVFKHADTDVTSQAQLLRGLTVFTDTCMGCHSAKYITYKGLMDYPELGISRAMADEFRGDNALSSGLHTELAPEDAVESYGKVPPDLSLVVPGRRGGVDYIYSLLTGYAHDESGRVDDGNYNTYFPGNRTAMPDPLGWLDHDAEDTAELEQQAHDVSAFLEFIADPHQNTRRDLGVYVMGFLLLLTLVLFLLKREVWKDVH